MVNMHKRPYKKGRREKAVIARVDLQLWKDLMQYTINTETTVTDIVEDCLIKFLHSKKINLTISDNKIK